MSEVERGHLEAVVFEVRSKQQQLVKLGSEARRKQQQLVQLVEKLAVSSSTLRRLFSRLRISRCGRSWTSCEGTSSRRLSLQSSSVSIGICRSTATGTLSSEVRRT